MAPRDRRLRLALAVVALLAIPPVTALFAGTPKMARPYPDRFAAGSGQALAEQRCLMCHNATLVTQQAKDSAGWARTLGTMKTWGTPLDSAETDTLLRWLAAAYGPRPGATPAAPGSR
jgi:mono/diheme cytochrome c family protein